jgi:hypothetical protein
MSVRKSKRHAHVRFVTPRCVEATVDRWLQSTGGASSKSAYAVRGIVALSPQNIYDEVEIRDCAVQYHLDIDSARTMSMDPAKHTAREKKRICTTTHHVRQFAKWCRSMGYPPNVATRRGQYEMQKCKSLNS